MKAHLQRSHEWIYQGIWAVLVDWFRVPAQPPSLPVAADDQLQAFQPAEGFLRYLRFQFWVFLAIIDGAILVAWIAVTLALPWLGFLLAGPAFFIAVVPDVVAYVAIHLRYDTTWYVLGSRSLRIRRGIWVIRETTITYENVQNIKVTQGPLERIFGIANVLVETAGGGAGGHQQGEGGAANMHCGRIEGVAHAQEIRDLVLARVRKSTATGLGDEREEMAAGRPPWTEAHLEALVQIRDAAHSLLGTHALANERHDPLSPTVSRYTQ
jgi:membrane protein YdbS with pleckstrin-like domain